MICADKLCWRPRLLPGAILFVLSISFSASGQPAQKLSAPGSDARAVEIADQVMEALGGRSNWEAAHYLTWNFFGRRLHVWDKWSGNLHLEAGPLLILMNVNTRTGQVWKKGEEVTNPDSLGKFLQFGYEAWINDSYWLLMPYKLRDEGVVLRYAGSGKTEAGAPAEILELTFQEVGVTPENKYHIYVDQTTHLVSQWAFFENAADDQPAIVTPWSDWRRFGNILLSGDRGRRKISDIAVFDQLPETVFSTPRAFHLQDYLP